MFTKKSILQKNANAIFVYIPEDAVKELDLKKFDEVKVDIESEALVIRKLNTKMNNKAAGNESVIHFMLVNEMYANRDDLIQDALRYLLHAKTNGLEMNPAQMLIQTQEKTNEELKILKSGLN